MKRTDHALSPAKENQSPMRKTPRPIVQELVEFVKMSGVKLPTHLDKGLKCDYESLLKPIGNNKNNSDTDMIKKLRVKLSDAEFEIKKME